MNIAFYDDGYCSLHGYLYSVMIHPVPYFANTMNTTSFISRSAKHLPPANYQVISVHCLLCQYINLSRPFPRVVVAMLHPA